MIEIEFVSARKHTRIKSPLISAVYTHDALQRAARVNHPSPHQPAVQPPAAEIEDRCCEVTAIMFSFLFRHLCFWDSPAPYFPL